MQFPGARELQLKSATPISATRTHDATGNPCLLISAGTALAPNHLSEQGSAAENSSREITNNLTTFHDKMRIRLE